MKRLFFGLWPSPAVRAALVAAQKALGPVPAQAVKPHNLHLTLEFLGTLDAQQAQRAAALALSIVPPPLRFALDHLQHFSRAEALVLDCCAAPQALLELQQSLHQRLLDGGFDLDARPYRPHVTLFREIRASAPAVASVPLVSWTASDFALIQSCGTADGVRYRPWRRYPLQTLGRSG